MSSLHCVITTIQSPTRCMEGLAARWPGADGSIWIVGDAKGPFSYDLSKTRLFDIEAQRGSPWQLAKNLPEKHYARKNLGYLEAINAGATCIFETDDDNTPIDSWVVRDRMAESHRLKGVGWYNVYRDFSDQKIWPRGLPLNHATATQQGIAREEVSMADSPLQQGLANGSPDVDAVWRLLLDQEITFHDAPSVRLARGLWCPFNSQSTWWWAPAFPLLYLPSYCPFRMTDIWRSFVAQRCLWELGFELVFHGAEMLQERNPHNPMHDFKDEVPGYLRNEEIRETLDGLLLERGPDGAAANLLRCYEALVAIDLIPASELPLVQAWIDDLRFLKVVK
jgi:hypothetical protein